MTAASIGISWRTQRFANISLPARATRAAALFATLIVGLFASPIVPAEPAPSGPVQVLVRGRNATATAEAVRRAGGSVTLPLEIIGGVAAVVPASSLDDIRRMPGITSVTADAEMKAQSQSYDAQSDPTSVLNVAGEVSGASAFWSAGIDGSGVDVALIDTGVTPVSGIDTSRLRHGPDLSFESQQDGLRYLDTYGHGTHMAGIIAGQDGQKFKGMAPGARLISLKVADATGATDVSQVIAAIDWVVQHRNTDGMNIRVLNLAYSTDSLQSYLIDPLAHAAEVAWRHGIVVVASAGNWGEVRNGLGNPAIDPYVIAVGAAHDADGLAVTPDVTVPAWSAHGDGIRNPDLVASGRSIASLRVPGSWLDENYPIARTGGKYFRGSGTSQAAALVSGAAALLIDQRPGITPDQVKSLLTGSATPVAGTTVVQAGAGLINLRTAKTRPTPIAVQAHPTSLGTGSLDLARGTQTVLSGGVPLVGEQDIFGNTWDAVAWAAAAENETSWAGGEWMGATWSGATWSGATWSGATWSGATWSGATWSGATWSGATWSGASWSGATWSGATWSGASWSGSMWG